MRKLIIGTVIACLYGFLFVYYSMYLDYVKGSMIGYLLMVAVTCMLSFAARLNHTIVSIFIGNLLTIIVSYYFVAQMERIGDWGYYFAPLSPATLLVVVSLLNFVPQFVSVVLADKYKKRIK